LWFAANEGGDGAFYSYDEAIRNFGNKLPTSEQLEELRTKCSWIWTGSGYKVVGPNGNSIYFPAAGRHYWVKENVGSNGYYWSSTPDKERCFIQALLHNIRRLIDSDCLDYAYFLFFSSGSVNVEPGTRYYRRSVRLVKD
jgi:hypothetical protein